MLSYSAAFVSSKDTLAIVAPFLTNAINYSFYPKLTLCLLFFLKNSSESSTWGELLTISTCCNLAQQQEATF